jgi:hypothetical protein
MKWEYSTHEIRDGGDLHFDMASEMNALGQQGWEFCDWISGWSLSEGSGPDTRGALFKRPTE